MAGRTASSDPGRPLADVSARPASTAGSGQLNFLKDGHAGLPCPAAEEGLAMSHESLYSEVNRIYRRQYVSISLDYRKYNLTIVLCGVTADWPDLLGKPSDWRGDHRFLAGLSKRCFGGVATASVNVPPWGIAPCPVTGSGLAPCDCRWIIKREPVAASCALRHKLAVAHDRRSSGQQVVRVSQLFRGRFPARESLLTTRRLRRSSAQPCA